MAWTFRAVGSFQTQTGNSTPGLPAGLAEDDLMLLVISSVNEPVAEPDGWDATPESPQGTGAATNPAASRLTVFWRKATSSEAAPTVTDPGNSHSSVILAFIPPAGGEEWTTPPWDDTAGSTATTNDTTFSAGSVTTTVDDVLVIVMLAHSIDALSSDQVGSWANANLDDLTERQDQSSALANGNGTAVVTGIKATAGATGATTATFAATNPSYGWIVLTLQPPPEDVEVEPTTASLALSTFAPSVAVTAHQSVVPDTAALTLTALAPTVAVTAHVLVTPPAAVLALTTYAPRAGTLTTAPRIVVDPILSASVSVGGEPRGSLTVDPPAFDADLG